MENTLASSNSQVPKRVELLVEALPGLASWASQLVILAQHGLSQMHTDDATAFVQTARGIRTPHGSELRGEGKNLRYAAIAALGLARLPLAAQRSVLGGSTARDLTAATTKKAHGHRETGAVALAAWAAAEVAGRLEIDLFDQLTTVACSAEPLATVDASWIVTAALAAKHLGDTSVLLDQAAGRLAEAQGPGGLFPHMMPASASGKFRAHLGSFADQVYPIQAFARLCAITGSVDALAAANRCASAICDLQGASGQWWWHYDSRGREVVEEYPVYSVHQHAMAPMVLFELHAAGGNDHRADIALGLDWLRTHPEVMDELVSPAHGVVWRKVGRREPQKAARAISAFATSIRAGTRVPGLNTFFPPGQIDYECRPYELAWLLYAWLSDGRTRRTVPD